MAEISMEPRNRRNPAPKQLDVRNYPFTDEIREMTVPNRVAHYLDWAAKTFPKTYTPYNLLYKAIMGQKTTPQLRNKEVEQLRQRLQSVKKILQDKYGRELDTQQGIGVRATVDAADTLTVSLPKRMRRLQSAKNAVVRTTDLIDPSRIPNTAEYRPWREWFNRDVRDVCRLLDDGGFNKKLLPPGQTNDDDQNT